MTSYPDVVSPNGGIFGPGTWTNVVSPVLHGTASGLDVGDVVLLYEGSTFLGQTRVNRAGTWAFQLDGLSEGAHTFTAYIVDAAGNRGTASNNFSLMVDLTPPTTGNSISITGYYDDQPPNIDAVSYPHLTLPPLLPL